MDKPPYSFVSGYRYESGKMKTTPGKPDQHDINGKKFTKSLSKIERHPTSSAKKKTEENLRKEKKIEKRGMLQDSPRNFSDISSVITA